MTIIALTNDFDLCHCSIGAVENDTILSSVIGLHVANRQRVRVSVGVQLGSVRGWPSADRTLVLELEPLV